MRGKQVSPGLSLIELLIALCISSVLTLAVFDFFYFFKEEYSKLYENHTSLTESILLVDFLQNLVSASNYFGCNQPKRKTINLFDKKTASLPSNVKRRMIQGTKGVKFEFQDSKLLHPFLPLSRGSEVIRLKDPIKLTKESVLVISDCNNTDEIEVLTQKDGNSKILLKRSLSQSFNEFSSVAIRRKLYLYVGRASGNRNALYLSENNRSEEISALIQSLEANWLTQDETLLWLNFKLNNRKNSYVPLILRNDLIG